MSMNLEAFMPCLGEVDACVESREVNVPEGCCPGQQRDSSRIITKGATLEVEFTINYSGTLFTLLSTSENWECEALFEDVGSASNLNVQKGLLVAHDPVGNSVTGTISVPWSPSLAGKMIKPVYKVTLHVGTTNTLLVCAFSEGNVMHFNES